MTSPAVLPVVPILLVAALPAPIPLDHAAPPGAPEFEPAAADPSPPPRSAPPPLPATRARAAPGDVASPAPAAAPVFPADARFTGEALRQAREARGLSLQQLADRTRITRHHLENVEADRYEKLPATVYLRGILTSVAKELRLDPGAVARTYLEARGASVAVGKER